MASRSSMVPMPFLLIVASSMAMLVSSSKIAEPEMTKISSINLPPNQFSDEKMFDIPGLQQCWASFSRIGGCVDEISLIVRAMKSGGGNEMTGLMCPVCCDVVKVMHEHCWPQMILDPFFIKINFLCALHHHHHHHHHHHSIPKIPTPVGFPPPMAPQVPVPAPSPAPQVPSPAPAPQDPPQSPAPPQYLFPTPPAPQDPPQSPAPPQYLYPSPTTQYPIPTPPGPI